MKQYKVIRDCWGFMLRPWKVGQIVDLPDDANPPHHFELIATTEDGVLSAPKVEEVAQEKPNQRDVMAPRAFTPGQPVKPVGGFAAKIDNTAPKQLETAAQAYQKRGRSKKA